MPFSKISSRIRTTWSILCVVFAGVLAFGSGASGECGGYVTIGNKAKLEELRAKGYLPRMEKHSAGESSITDSERHRGSTENSTEKFIAKSIGESLAEASNDSEIPARPLPCSGLHCRPNHRSPPAPQCPPLTSFPLKIGFGGNLADVENWDADQFVGRNPSDQAPVKTVAELDRPPE